ncbi:putative hydrolase of the HAD superfamily [Paenibacillus sp. 1_12]|uniref:HAD family hydrolase n=1 Tax=Paenibacillus sp. 1_12 TaxID=1566278 RepID=UPI0008E08C30|nr:HAD family hydrolase [Paenibacillus sp. 1_12]SFM14316.1 putative hydrolase of the HAD superfamily [Paenibacillus sp. 1_12]
MLEARLPKAILLDMDDTIISYDHGVDTDQCWRDACGHLSEQMDIEHVIAAIKARAKWHWSDPERHRIGRMDLRKARSEIIAAALEQFELTNSANTDQIASTYGELRDKAIQPFIGAIETVQRLKAMGIKLALLTNGNTEPQWNKINKFGLAPLFDIILVEGEFGIGKPDARIYHHAIQQLGAAAEDTWMVGDNFEWEIAAPQRLGIKGIWIDHKKVGVPVNSETQPYRIIHTLSELLEL